MAGEGVRPEAGGQKPDDTELSAAELRSALDLERAKNEVLLGQVIQAEDALADRDAEEFADVIPNEDRGFWRGQFLENREAAVGLLNRMRARLTPAARTEAAPAALAVPPAAGPRPLHNRAEAKPAVAEKGLGGAPGPTVERAAYVRNRADQIAKAEKRSYVDAFRRAEREAGKG